jgi:hypothetical protein
VLQEGGPSTYATTQRLQSPSPHPSAGHGTCYWTSLTDPRKRASQPTCVWSHRSPPDMFVSSNCPIGFCLRDFEASRVLCTGVLLWRRPDPHPGGCVLHMVSRAHNPNPRYTNVPHLLLSHHVTLMHISIHTHMVHHYHRCYRHHANGSCNQDYRPLPAGRPSARLGDQGVPPLHPPPGPGHHPHLPPHRRLPPDRRPRGQRVSPRGLHQLSHKNPAHCSLPSIPVLILIFLSTHVFHLIDCQGVRE